ncbi:DUF3320 domain-containing protein [Mycobacterium sp. SM3041]|uniref:DUF3320 domain-containing protein n=1 Tax=Mycobacterium sp. SM3041 TaxID=3114291 RepID=UPI003204FB58
MANVDHHQVVGQALKTLAGGLAPFVAQVLNRVLPPGTDWAQALKQKDAAAGKAGNRDFQNSDVALMLRAMTERLGTLGYPFNGQMSRQAEAYAKELKGVRNSWAHTEPFTQAEAHRAIETAELLLRAIGAVTQAQAVAELKASLSQPQTAVTTEPTSAISAAAQLPEPGPQSATIQITAIADLSYAMAHCRIPVIEQITVDNTGGEAHGAVLEVDIVSADGSHGGPTELHLDLSAGQQTVLTEINLKLDPASMLSVDEQRPGEIRAVLKNAAGDILAAATKSVNILAANQWKAVPPQLAMELMAAYAQPNSAAVATLLLEASDRLKASTGNSALNGYQSEDPQRVDAIARAVFEAMKARDIRYAEPPASWGDVGQKVRTPAEVLKGRLGTCLDTALVMSAVLEQAGINSTIWLLRGHALLGYWREEKSLETVSTIETAGAVNTVDLGNIGLVETTMVTDRHSSLTFDDARRAPKASGRLDDISNIMGVTDIRQARQAGIFPLPSRTVKPDGQIEVIEYQPIGGQVIRPYEAGGATHTAQVQQVPPRVQQWKNALLDLSLRNKLINYTDRSGYRIEIPGPNLGYFEDAVNEGMPISLLGSDEIISAAAAARGVRYGRDLSEGDRQVLLADKRSAYIDITEASYTSKLRYLANKARTITQETGANNLYLAFGMLCWQFNGKELRSPLVLVPVTITPKNKGQRYVLTIDEAGISTPNYCLVEKLRTALDLDIPALANPNLDASGIDLDGTFRAVREAIQNLNFHIEETVHLSVLQFAKYPLWKDLDDSWNQLSANSLVKHLIEGNSENFADTAVTSADVDLDELGVSVPMSADSSQLRAVADAVGGRTFVLEGPPGTGKSQTITNLLAHAMASGQRVLFVAEKRAALDVVKKRLESVGLGDLALDIHDRSAKPAAVRAQIKQALELHVTHDPDLLHSKLQTVKSNRHKLANYARELHAANAAGLSLYSARNTELAADSDVPPLEVPKAFVASGNPELREAVANAIRGLSEKTDLAKPRKGHPWSFVEVVPPNGLDASKIYSAAVEFDSALEAVQGAGIALDVVVKYQDLVAVDTWARLTGEPRYPIDGVDALHTSSGQTRLVAVEQLLAKIVATQPEWFAVAKPSAMDLEIPEIHSAAVAADESGFFGRKKRRRAVLEQLADVLAVEPETVKLKTLSATTSALNDTYTEVTQLRELVAALPVVLFDQPWNPFVAEDAAHLRDSVAALRRVGAVLSTTPADPRVMDLRKFYSDTASGASGQQLRALAVGWQKLSDATATTPVQQNDWAGDESFIQRWWATRSDRKLETAATTERWVDLLLHLEPLRIAGMEVARTEILNGTAVGEDAPAAYDRGTATASTAERLAASGLNDFDVVAHNKAIGRFTESSAVVRGELKRSIAANILAARKFDVATGKGKIGELKKLVDAKKSGKGVRYLMEHYGDLITQILPCTLTSPDSVARFFPARANFFDVVVFDEASQIRVADAIGAMGRARSVVVVGDSKQMPPTSFAEVNAAAADDEDADEIPGVVADEESILSECVSSQVPQQWLSWHYRSQDEALIAFSNLQYYSGRLASFPTPLADSAGYGVSMIRVNGHFNRTVKGKTLRTNEVEAKRIVADIQERFSASSDSAPSVGVITFNAQQRDLIENMLRDTGDERLLAALDEPDGLFVKNLENVQGDERDTILFSIAFSKNDKGALPLNFGPLSKPGGERRLNVAVTRARCEVVLYASFDPADLRAEETTQVGTKHLKAYLELAARGVQTITQGGKRNAVIDRHRDDIADALRAEGLVVRTDVGLSDFRVDLVIADPDDPARPLIAVLLDGAEWSQRGTVADRDGLPVDVLSSLMHWPVVERVWMPEWLHHRAATVERLQNAVVEAKRKLTQVAESEVTAPVSVVEPAVEMPTTAEPVATQGLVSFKAEPATVPTTPRHPNIADFKAWIPVVAGDRAVLDELHLQSAEDRVLPIIREVIEAEAPISREQLAKVIANAFGWLKVSEERKQSLQRLVPADYQRANDPDFYWPLDVFPESWRLVRVPKSGVTRPIENVSLVEIGNAMVIVAQQSGGALPDELKREAMKMFGVTRTGPKVAARLDEALQRALTLGLLLGSHSGELVAR